MADQDDTLLREVDADLQRERFAKLWDQYGLYVAGAAALVILGVGGFKWTEHRNRQAAEAAGASYFDAVRAANLNKPDDARTAFATISSSSNRGYATLARIRLASADAKAGKNAEAIAAFEALAAERSTDPVFSDYARLQIAMLKLDTANWTEMQNRLTDLSGELNPWRHSARELLGLAAMKAGQTTEAQQHFARLLGDRTTPPGIGERVRIVMAALTEAELARPGRDQGGPVPPPAVVPAPAETPAATPSAPRKTKSK